jgi:RNA polymerase sigma-70 factor (ECF subfamily)
MFLPWACRIAFNEVRNFYRVCSRDRLRFTDELLQSIAEERLSDLDISQERLGALASCIAELQDADRELIQAAYHDERLVAEIAASIGKALQTVYNRLSVLRRRLLDCVEHKVVAGGGQA